MSLNTQLAGMKSLVLASQHASPLTCCSMKVLLKQSDCQEGFQAESCSLPAADRASSLYCRCIICKDKVYILSVPTPGKPLNCGTALSADNFFVKDLVARVRPPQAGLQVQK